MDSCFGQFSGRDPASRPRILHIPHPFRFRVAWQLVCTHSSGFAALTCARGGGMAESRKSFAAVIAVILMLAATAAAEWPTAGYWRARFKAGEDKFHIS